MLNDRTTPLPGSFQTLSGVGVNTLTVPSGANMAAHAALIELRRRLAEIADLKRADKILSWDHAVWMPPSGSEARAAQLAALEAVTHERFVDDRIGELLDELEPYGESLPYDSDDACLLRVTRHDWEKARRVPGALMSELAKNGAEAYDAWVRAFDLDPLPFLKAFQEVRLDLDILCSFTH